MSFKLNTYLSDRKELLMKQKNQTWTIIAVIAAAFLLVAVIYRPLFFSLMIVAGIMIILGSIFFLINYLWNLRKKDDFQTSVDDSLDRQFSICTEQIQKNNREIKDIRKNIKDLESSLDQDLELMDNYRQESKRILAGFYKELDLRKAKIDFYQTCKVKLETLQYNHNFSEKLAQKQRKLNELQEEHYEDLANMETFKTTLEYNKHYMETIETLSLRMLESNSLDSAQQLQLELKEITKELRRM